MVVRFLLSLIICLNFCASAQTIQRNYGIEISPKIGFLIPHRATMGHLLQGHSKGFEISGVIQTDGRKQWHHDYLFPKGGISLYYSDWGNKEVLGTGFGIHGFITLPFIKKKGWSFASRLGAGIGYSTKIFDQTDNPKNNALGTKLNSLVLIGAEIEKQFKRSSIALGVDMTHFSNGAVKVPNLGVNIAYISLAYTYYFKELDQKLKASIHRLENKNPSKWRMYSELVLSTKQIYPTGGRNYGIIGISNFAQYQIKPKCVIEGGVDAVYNQSIIEEKQGDFTARDNFQLGAYAAYILPIHKLQLILGMGGYIVNPVNPNGSVYHRFGSRFKIGKNLYANITIKSHWAKADYFEYGIIYRWK
ncbi:MAG: hypothetical protein COA32_15100 [Fluviicola sp.]|nr:MAG: hypothetical protein COA32_15100 [Fluviicola sp.]